MKIVAAHLLGTAKAQLEQGDDWIVDPDDVVLPDAPVPIYPDFNYWTPRLGWASNFRVLRGALVADLELPDEMGHQLSAGCTFSAPFAKPPLLWAVSVSRTERPFPYDAHD